MQPDGQALPHDTTHTATDRTQGTTWSWLKSPWVLLIFGGVILLGLWVGIGLLTEQRRSAAVEELRDKYGVLLDGKSEPRFPDWIRGLLEEMLPPDWTQIDVYETAVVDRCDDESIVRLLSRIGELDSITFADGCTLSDAAVLELIETHHLQQLRFAEPRSLTPQQLAAWRERGGVKGSLVLQGPFNKDHLRELSQMMRLQVLHLIGPVDTDDALPPTGWPALGSLRWDDSQLTDAQFAVFGAAPELTGLYLERTRLTSRSGALLERLPLERLHLESQDADDALVECIGRIRSLESVSLPQGRITDAGLRAVAQLPGLGFLRIAARGLTVSSARSLRELANLHKITIDTDASVTDEWIAEFVHEQLNRIELINSAITDEGVATIQKNCPNAFTISLAGSRVTDQCLPVLSNMPRLIDLDLSNTAITDAGLQQVDLTRADAGYPRLRKLNLSGTRVTREGALDFAQRHGSSILGVRLSPKEVVRIPSEPRTRLPFPEE